MLHKIYLPQRRLKGYNSLLTPGLFDELHDLAADLQDFRFVHLNSTARGGGVAEILRSLVPLMRALGLMADWYVLESPASFFNVTKRIHDLLQGQQGALPPDELSSYLGLMRQEALSLDKPSKLADIWFLHDPQLLPLAHYLQWPAELRRLWVCHIDLSAPNPDTLEALLPLMGTYDAAVFSLPTYVPPHLNGGSTHIIPPAIDPLSCKNRPLSGPFSRNCFPLRDRSSAPSGVPGFPLRRVERPLGRH